MATRTFRKDGQPGQPPSTLRLREPVDERLVQYVAPPEDGWVETTPRNPAIRWLTEEVHEKRYVQIALWTLVSCTALTTVLNWLAR